MRELLHFFLSKSTEFISFNPWPSSNISNGILPLARSCKVIAGFAGIPSRQTNLQYAIDTEGLIVEAVNGIYSTLSQISIFFVIYEWWQESEHGIFSLANFAK